MNRSDVLQLVDALCRGDENAYHTLIEADDDIVPTLIDEFRDATNGERRGKILEIIWQHRIPDTIAFLTSTLDDEHRDVWKEALDGLVTIGGNESRNALNDCLGRIAPDDERAIWIAEAIDQIQTHGL